jgi:DNA-binding transcriptional MerR regulator
VERRLSLDLGVTVKIGELASRTGVNASAIRYYEKLSLVPAPYRASGQRCYTDEAIYRVLLIRFAREMDFSLEEIKIFLSGLTDKAPVGKRWKGSLNQKLKRLMRPWRAHGGSSHFWNICCTAAALHCGSVLTG